MPLAVPLYSALLRHRPVACCGRWGVRRIRASRLLALLPLLAITVVRAENPAINVQPLSRDGGIAFGAHDIGTTTVPTPILFTNSGKTPLRIDAWIDDSTEYAIVRNECGQTYSSGSGCQIEVAFSPKAKEGRSGYLRYNYAPGEAGKAESEPVELTLSGEGFLPDVAVYPASLSFRRGSPSGTGAPESVTLTNNTAAKITIGRISVSDGFDLQAPVPREIGPQRSISLQVSSRPMELGTARGMLVVVSDSKLSPQNIPLTSTSGNNPMLPAIPNFWQTVFAAMVCLFYWLGMAAVRWFRIALRARKLLKAEIDNLSVAAELATVAGAPAALVAQLKAMVGGNFLANFDPAKFSFGDFAIWSRGDELAGWARIHQATVQLVPWLPDEEVLAQLDFLSGALADTASCSHMLELVKIESAAGKLPDPLRRKALLKGLLNLYYDREDTAYAGLLSWQNKAGWLLSCGLFLILVLVSMDGHANLFVIGALGGLLSRLSRTLHRTDTPMDYGASWTTIFLSPVAGALAGWAGILFCAAAVKFQILGAIFEQAWDDPHKPLVMGLALAFGFSERLLDNLFGQLDSKFAGPAGQAPVTPPRLVPPVFTITNASLPPGVVGGAYPAQQLAVNPAIPNARWMVTGLPAGLACSAAGQISGTPAGPAVAAANVQIRVDDPNDPTKVAAKSIPLTIT